MSRYFIELSFMGTRYVGWQVQPGGVTVQEVLEKSFSAFLHRPVAITGAGRTDAGVHARNYTAHFDAENLPLPLPDLVYKLNRFLPEDIVLHSIRPVIPEAHARFSAISRTYRYFIRRQKDPFASETSLEYHLPLDVEKMNEAASLLLKHTDFTSFSKLHTDVKTNNCRITEAYWEVTGNQLVFSITADRFLRNMVRAIVGTLIEVGKGKLPVEGFEEIILKKNRCAAGTSVPAKGLFLTGITYPGNVWLQA
jgi:tRNA pseudouridine38-40 synthase